MRVRPVCGDVSSGATHSATPPGMPDRLKGLGITLIVLVVVVALVLLSRGQHGPGMDG